MDCGFGTKSCSLSHSIGCAGFQKKVKLLLRLTVRCQLDKSTKKRQKIFIKKGAEPKRNVGIEKKARCMVRGATLKYWFFTFKSERK